MDLCRRLEQVFGKAFVRCDPGTLDRFSGDALSEYRAFEAAPLLEARAEAVFSPTEPDQVVELLKLANRERFPVVPYGAGTGVMGAAIPVRGGVILDLSRLNRILEVDPEALTATVEPGVILEDLHQRLKGKGLMLGHDPWSRPIATVGGAISTDGVGYLAAAYGSMGAQVLGLEVVLPTGKRLSFPGVPKGTGPDLRRLFIGSEGLFGVIVQAIVRVFPLPEVREIRAYRFPDFPTGFRALLALRGRGLRPSLVDYYEEFSLRRKKSRVFLFLGFEGPEEVVQASWKEAEKVLRMHEAEAQPPEMAEEFWETRHDLAVHYARHALGSPYSLRRKVLARTPMDYIHVSLPASRVLAYREKVAALLEASHLRIREWSIWGYPEFFSFLVYDLDPRWKRSRERMGEAVAQVIQLAQKMGGSMEYCHGIGLKLMRCVEGEWGEAGMEMLRSLKRSLDPNGILNPGKWAG